MTASDCPFCERIDKGDPCNGCPNASSGSPAITERERNLAAMIRVLCAHTAGPAARDRAMDLLRRYGLQGSPLRGGAGREPTEATEACSTAVAHRTIFEFAIREAGYNGYAFTRKPTGEYVSPALQAAWTAWQLSVDTQLPRVFLDLLSQVETFVERHGEADFELGPAKALQARLQGRAVPPHAALSLARFLGKA